MKLTILTLSAFSSALFIVGCAESPKVDIPGTTYQEVERLGTELETAKAHHLDVLAYEDFTGAQKAHTKAQEALNEDRNNEKALEQASRGRASLRKGFALAKTRRPSLEGILKTREMTLTSGVRNYPAYETKLAEIDEEFRDLIKNLSDMSPKDFSLMQSRYMDLELDTLKSNNLWQTKALIDDAAAAKKAGKIAPKTLKKAQFDLTNAENMIAAHRGRPENYKNAVAQASYSALLLVDVLAAAIKEDGNLDEDTAMKIVLQKRRISALQGQLGSAQAEKMKMGQTIQEQGKKMAVASLAIRLQRAIESARKTFTKQEAEVYQEGNRLLIRLKAMNFKSGGSDLPATSLSLLAKVRKVVADLGAQEVMIEGHTDSSGAEAGNDDLSQARAEAVANYLATNGFEADKVKAIGYGFKKPIATNRTSQGRAQNRRVDVIITPSLGEARKLADTGF